MDKSFNIKKLILSTLGGSFTMWLLAGLWHQLIMAGFYKQETHASHEGTGIILIAYVILGLLMALIYPIGYKGKPPWIEGLRFGALVGILWVFPHELAMAGAHGGAIGYVVKNALWHIFEQGAGGIVIGVIYGRRISSGSGLS
jgi:hypothetical protein